MKRIQIILSLAGVFLLSFSACNVETGVSEVPEISFESLTPNVVTVPRW
jgi:hypothetical protein